MIFRRSFFDVVGLFLSILDARRCWNIAGSETPFLLPRRGLSMSVSQSNKNSSQSYKLRETTKHRLKLEKIGLARKLAAFEPKVALRVAACGTHLQFDLYEHVQDQHQHCRRLALADFCGKRKFCPQCAANYSEQVAADFLGRLSRLQRGRKAVRLAPYRLIFLTLTVKNCLLSQLRETLRMMSKAWDRLARSKRFAAAAVGGWFRGVEYIGDETPAGYAHPHYHCLIIVGSSYYKNDYIKQEEWCQMWRQALRADYDPVVDVRRVRPRARKVVDACGKTYEHMQGSASAAAAEVAKYSVAPWTIRRQSDSDFKTLYEQTKGGRQYALGGKIKDTEPDPPETLDPELWRYIGVEIWRWGQGQYVMTQFSEVHNDDGKG